MKYWKEVTAVICVLIAAWAGFQLGAETVEPEVVEREVAVKVVADPCLAALEDADTLLRELATSLEVYTSAVADLSEGDVRGLQQVADLDTAVSTDLYITYTEEAKECRDGA